MLGDILGGIGSGIGSIAVLAGAAGKGGKDQYKQAAELWRKLELSNFDMSKLSPPEQRMVMEMVPQEYAASDPGQVALTEDSPLVRQSQLQNLGQLEEIGQAGLPLADFLGAQEMQRAAGNVNRRYTGSVLQNLAERGRLGGGSELAARMQGGQQAAEMARGMGSDLTRDAMGRRLQALAMSGQLAGGIRGQDIGVSGQRANQKNQFAEWLSRLRTQVAGDNAGARERAQNYNVGTRQGLANENVMNRYANTVRNQEYPNMLQNQMFGQRLQKTKGQAGALQDYGHVRYAEQAAKAQNIKGIGQGLGKGVGGILGGLYGI